MKRSILASARSLSSAVSQPWICRQCLAERSVRQSNYTPEKTARFPRTAARAYSTIIEQPAPGKDALAASSPDPASYEPDARLLNSDYNGLDPAFIQRFLSEPGASERRTQMIDSLCVDLHHDIPPQHLIYVDPGALTEKEKAQRQHLFKWAMTGHVNNEGEPKNDHARDIKGVVVSAGKMHKTVKVRVPKQVWEPRIKKYFASFTNHLVNDPNNSLVEGDVVLLHRMRAAKTVRHVIGRIITPFGKPLNERAPVWTPEERLALYKAHRLAKFRREELRHKAIKGDEDAKAQLRAMGLDENNVPQHKTKGKVRAPRKQKRQTEENLQQAQAMEQEHNDRWPATESIPAS